MNYRTMPILILILVNPANAQWSIDPAMNTPVTVATGNQSDPVITSDGFGGSFVAWSDRRGQNLDIYVQHFDNLGTPRWTTNGNPSCTATGDQDHPQITADGVGGVIVCWRDGRSSDPTNIDIYAQHFDYGGNALWTADGIPVCDEPSRQSNPTIISDNAGGAIIVWEDARNGFNNTDIYAQRVSSSGAMMWQVNGSAVTTAASFQQFPSMVSDGLGGAFVAWKDTRTGNGDVFAARLNTSGTNTWLLNGVPVATDSNSQENQMLLEDGAGGVFIVWEDLRNGTDDNLFMQRLNVAGSAQWLANGIQVTGAGGDQVVPQIITDGAGGAIVAWHDLRNGFGNSDVYAQRVSPSGVIQWGANGAQVCTVVANQNFPQFVADGSGGAVFAWSDDRNGAADADIFSQRVNGGGGAMWAANGIAISRAPLAQDQHVLIPDGGGGAVIAWRDARNEITSDVYFQNISAAGNLGEVALVVPLVNAPSIVASGTAAQVNVTLPPNFQPTVMDLYYRNGGERTYQTITMTQNGSNLQGTIPANAANLRGIEFYTSVGNVNGTITYPPVTPDQNPNIIRVEFANPVYPISLIPKQFRMVSLPYRAINPSVSAVFIDDFGTYDQRIWRVFHWEADSSREYPFIQSMLEPGNAFWLVTRNGNSFGAGTSRSSDASQTTTLTLAPGWNQIANPFAFPIAWSDITINGLGISGAYYFDGTQYLMPAQNSILEPWEGYFVEDTSGQVATLTMPRFEAQGGEASYPVGEANSVYSISVMAMTEDPRFRDTENVLGFRSSSSGQTPDYREPPIVADVLRLSLVDGNQRFMQKFKNLSPEGDVWELELQSPQSHDWVTISFTESGILPNGFDLYLFDLDDETIIPLPDRQFSIGLQAGDLRRFRLVIGTEGYAERQSMGISLVSLTFSLAQNYPNPFNPITTIRYQLGKRSHVILEISNVLGQTVRSLVNEVESSGLHVASWDGTNTAGAAVGSGVYFYRLRTAGFTSVRRMVLLR